VTIRLTPEQERRIQAVIGSGAYSSVNELLDAALASVEGQSAASGVDTRRLDSLLMEGLASAQLSEEDFWTSIDNETNALLNEQKPGPRS
jgi:Arc/MetJ-type ribon-helix-helix transcriptional regulator